MRLAVVLLLLVLGACAPAGPQPIAWGKENCDYCRMLVDDPRFGAEIVTSTGKKRVFDSVECMASYYEQEHASGKLRGAWVSDFRKPGTLIPAEDAVFIRGSSVASPMGMGLIATADADPSAAVRALGGTALKWGDVRALVARESPAHAHDSAGRR